MELSTLPAPIWVDQPSALRKMIATLNNYPILAVDTESNSLFAYQEQVCLIQFSTPQEDYLVDPLSLSDLNELGPIFANPAIEKIFHAAEYDIICLKRDFNFTFTNIFDTMIAARVLGRQAVGLGPILEEEFGISLDKRYQRANWGTRPLPHAQLSYARLDTHYLILLRSLLKGDLEETGRWHLAEEDFKRLTRIEASNGKPNDNGSGPVWKIVGSQELTSQQLAVLQQLSQYRERQARLSNRPPFKVLSNQALLEIAQACPASLADLGALSEISSRLVDRYGKDLIHTVQAGLTALPPVRPYNPRPDDQYLARLEALRNWRKHAAQGMGVESDVILPRDMMQEIASANPRSCTDLARVMSNLPIRLDQFGKQICETLQIE